MIAVTLVQWSYCNDVMLMGNSETAFHECHRTHMMSPHWFRPCLIFTGYFIIKMISCPYCNSHHKDKIDGFVKERRNSIANALELRLSCTNPSRRSDGHLIFITGIPIPVRMVYILDQAPNILIQYKDVILPVQEISLWRQDDLTTVLSPQWDFLYC